MWEKENPQTNFCYECVRTAIFFMRNKQIHIQYRRIVTNRLSRLLYTMLRLQSVHVCLFRIFYIRILHKLIAFRFGSLFYNFRILFIFIPPHIVGLIMVSSPCFSAKLRKINTFYIIYSIKIWTNHFCFYAQFRPTVRSFVRSVGSSSLFFGMLAKSTMHYKAQCPMYYMYSTYVVGTIDERTASLWKCSASKRPMNSTWKKNNSKHCADKKHLYFLWKWKQFHEHWTKNHHNTDKRISTDYS